jgi:hypothetical protein
MPEAFRSLQSLCVPIILFVACSGEGVGALGRAAPSVDQAKPVMGVPDRGADPAVVAIESEGQVLCAGALIASDAVLTARHCVAILAAGVVCSADERTAAVALRAARSMRVWVGDEMTGAEPRARGRDIVVPGDESLCKGDIALILLDTSIDDVQPLAVRSTGAARGDHLRTVTFLRPISDNSVTMKYVRDHVPVLASTTNELQVAEVGCVAGCGGPALSEATGEIVGVLSRGDPQPKGATASDVYIRTDAFLTLIENVLAPSSGATSSAGHKKKEKRGSVDMGANCTGGSDCAAGACVTDGGRRYCSRECGAHDHCPAHFRCQQSAEGERVCVES